MYKAKESLSCDGLANIQLHRLKETIQKVYNHSIFYKQEFDSKHINPSDIQSLDDIKKLPFTTKDDIRKHYPFKMLCVDKRELSTIHCSSGSSGVPTAIGYSKKDIALWSEVMARCYSICGVSKDDIVHNAYGYGLFTGGLGFHYGAMSIDATIVPASTGNSNRQLELLRDFESSVLACTPTYALHLANIAKNTNIEYLKDYNLKVGIFGAEPTSISLKEKIAKAWDIDYHEIYGLSEIIGPGVACSCKHSNNLHVLADHFYIEIIDPVTQQLLPIGKKGELVITTLSKDAMPLIRYKTGDITSIVPTKCTCSNNMPQIEPILARSDDMVIVNGVNIYPSQVEDIISKIENLTLNYQIIVDKKSILDTIEVEDESYISDKKFIKDIEKRLKESLLINVTVLLLKYASLTFDKIKKKRVIDKR